MSTVLDYFKVHPISDDPLHRELSKIAVYHARLQQIRKDKLACCGCEEAASGAVKLVVVDNECYAKLKAEEATITARLDALDSLVQRLDVVFEAASNAGFHVSTKTPKGIRATEVNWRATYGKRRTDDFGKPYPTESHPELLKLTKQAEALMVEAGL